ncbi:hypothetical protein DBR28_03385 [Chryseobacterium sp. HMWF028]|nr:hypothetical protein DBR28_03385 [Chryseobacterium sp. HMWF028]
MDTKKALLLFNLLIFSGSCLAQVGINTSNPQQVFHIDGSKDNSLTGAPTPAQKLNDFVVTQEGKVGVGNTSPITKIDARSDPGNLLPGDGSIAIGETAVTAVAAGAGAVRYNPVSGGVIEYSDGSIWKKLGTSQSTTLAYGNIQTGQPLYNGDGNLQTTVSYDNGNNITANKFIVSKPGNYLATTCLLTTYGIWNNGNELSVRIRLNNNIQAIGYWQKQGGAGNSNGGNCTSTTFTAAVGDVIDFTYYQGGSSYVQYVTSPGFNKWSIIEL